MIISDIITLILLAVMLFWAVYNGVIIYVGIRIKRNIRTVNYEENYRFPTISIIIPTKNEELVISRCLEGIIKINYPREKMQIIIVDGNSSDKTRQICLDFKEKYPELFKVINESASKGKPAALNIALAHADGEIVGVFDSDNVPEPNVLKKVATYFANDQKIVALQGRTTSLNEKNNILTRIIAMEEKTWFQTLLSGREKLRLFVPLNGSCQFVRRHVIEELGGWDENSLTEDVELALRLVEKNYFIKYAPDVFSAQETPSGFGNLVRQRVRWYRGYMETALKYGRLLDTLNRKTVDAEISLIGPFIMVISFLSYINWFCVAIFLSYSNAAINFTGLVIALTAFSLISLGIALTASQRPIKLRNILWVPSIYIYWLLQMFIAVWAFLKLLFRGKRVWTKTNKTGISCDKNSDSDV